MKLIIQQLKLVVELYTYQRKWQKFVIYFFRVMKWWSDEVIHMLERNNAFGAPEISAQKEVCYLLEKTFDLLLGKKSVSSNPGFKKFDGQ